MMPSFALSLFLFLLPLYTYMYIILALLLLSLSLSLSLSLYARATIIFFDLCVQTLLTFDQYIRYFITTQPPVCVCAYHGYIPITYLPRIITLQTKPYDMYIYIYINIIVVVAAIYILCILYN